MEWTRLRAMFGPRTKIIKHKGKLGRKLGNKTYAYLYVEDNSDLIGNVDRHIEIEMFNKVIIRFYPDGSFSPTNHGYWDSPTTRARFREFLPHGGYITSFTLKDYDRPNQYKARKRYVWTLGLRGIGVRPYRDGALYTSSGEVRMLPQSVQEVNANDLIVHIKAFTKKNLVMLRSGALEEDGRCETCRLHVTQSLDLQKVLELPSEQDEEKTVRHVLYHVLENKPSLALFSHALLMLGDSKQRQAADLFLKENRPAWKYPRNNTMKAQRVELLLTKPHLFTLGVDPLRYLRVLQWVLTEYLLVRFGWGIS